MRGRDLLQLREHLRRADISRVHDHIGAAQSGERLVANETVGVRNDAHLYRMTLR
jgi:hypothetical protein